MQLIKRGERRDLDNSENGIDEIGLNQRASLQALSRDELCQIIVKDYRITKEFWESIYG